MVVKEQAHNIITTKSESSKHMKMKKLDFAETVSVRLQA